VFAYLSSFLSVPLGLAWGWGLSFLRGPVDATGQRASDFAVRGLGWCMLAATAPLTVDLVARLILYGHDKSIGSTEIAAGMVFLGVMTLSAAGITLNISNLNAWLALRQAGIGFGCSIMLAVGMIIAAVAVESLFLGLARLVEAWNVLFFFYPFYLGGSFALAAVLFFYGGRIFARTWPRLSLA
jgi:hypothetical protein